MEGEERRGKNCGVVEERMREEIKEYGLVDGEEEEERFVLE